MPEEVKSYTKQDFIKVFNNLARHKHRYDVFRDFVTMSAISLHNAINRNEELEQEYMQIIGQYKKEEVKDFSKLLTILVDLLNPEPRDILGSLYMELDLGNDNTGQFFTPPDISELMAKLSYGDQLKTIDQPFITLSEPACGAGGMVLAFVKVMLENKHNPADKLWVQCIDIDRLAGLMCYLQLSLWHVPAEVIIGNTLSLEFRQRLYTPAHYMGNWDIRLQYRQIKEELAQVTTPIPETDKPEISPAKEQPESEKIDTDTVGKGDNFQFDFGF